MTDQKIALVTGANRGIGKATARQLAQAGYTVWLAGRDLAGLDSAAQEIRDFGGAARAVRLDVTDPASIAAAVAIIGGEHDHLDALINNAGILPERGGDVSVWAVTEDAVLQTLTTNTLGPLRVTRAFRTLLEAAPAGRVVNISSSMGALGDAGPGYPGYRMSKTALNMLTVVLAAEWRDSQVKVNAIDPGWVKTDMGGASAPRDVDTAAQGIVWAATLPDDGPTGGFFRDCQPIDW